MLASRPTIAHAVPVRDCVMMFTVIFRTKEFVHGDVCVLLCKAATMIMVANDAQFSSPHPHLTLAQTPMFRNI